MQLIYFVVKRSVVEHPCERAIVEFIFNECIIIFNLLVPIYCEILPKLFPVMRRKRSGCWVNGDFVIMLGYADDIMLLSPTLEGLQDMVDTCAAI